MAMKAPENVNKFVLFHLLYYLLSASPPIGWVEGMGNQTVKHQSMTSSNYP